jgi:putative tryptophan/tyrosine transport system substrate-binding protein
VRRRRFIVGLASTTASLPLAVRAQQPARLPTVGILGPTTPAAQPEWTAGFVPRLRELGWVEGSTVAIESRWAEGHSERFAEIAAEFVHLKVDTIVTSGAVAVLAAKAVTTVVPIIFVGAGDPVGNGLVASLARPGGNVTGQSVQQPDSAGKRLELLREVLPDLRSLAIITKVDAPASVRETDELRSMASALGLEVIVIEIRRAEDIAPAFGTLRGHPQALYVVTEPLLTANRIKINTLALAARLATMYTFRDNVEAGGLMSYGPNLMTQFRRSADLVDKILRGEKPADIPVEQPTKFDLVINLTTAKALGLTLPPTLLARADEVIE